MAKACEYGVNIRMWQKTKDGTIVGPNAVGFHFLTILLSHSFTHVTVRVIYECKCIFSPRVIGKVVEQEFFPSDVLRARAAEKQRRSPTPSLVTPVETTEETHNHANNSTQSRTTIFHDPLWHTHITVALYLRPDTRGFLKSEMHELCGVYSGLEYVFNNIIALKLLKRIFRDQQIHIQKSRDPYEHTPPCAHA